MTSRYGIHIAVVDSVGAEYVIDVISAGGNFETELAAAQALLNNARMDINAKATTFEAETPAALIKVVSH